MFIGELEALDKSQSLVHIAANREIIDGDLPQNSLAVNDKKTPECNSIRFFVDLISLKRKNNGKNRCPKHHELWRVGRRGEVL